MDLERTTNRSRPIPVMTQIHISLRYLAKGDFCLRWQIYMESVDPVLVTSYSFVTAVNVRLDNIRFPDDEALTDMKQGFYQRCQIPNVTGAVDGTLIPIIAPSENDIYVCRKNFHAINVQAVVDHKARFIDLVAKWPGSSHDSSIFENCGLKGHLERTHKGHLLSDSGYGLKKHLFTPVLDPATASEAAYNQAPSSGRMVIERAFGLMKSRFRCLHKTGGVLYRQPGKCCRVIIACAKLHNFCMEHGIQQPDYVLVQANEREDAEFHIQPDTNVMAYRQQITCFLNNFCSLQNVLLFCRTSGTYFF